jgi:hypothetical protein
MRSSSTALVRLLLAVWAVLGIAPLAGICMAADCSLATGVRSAHCGTDGATMLCCDRGTSQPLEVTITNPGPLARASMVELPSSAEDLGSRDALSPVVVSARHGPPLYALFATLLI